MCSSYLSSLDVQIVDLTVEDIRFPTSLELDGSDALHPSPDYAACYVVLNTNSGQKGFGITFTLGRGNEIVAHCIDSLRFLVVGCSLKDIFTNMGAWLYKVNNEGQLRWLGPEKGVIGLSVGGIVNALWDLRARIVNKTFGICVSKLEGKPVWKILVDSTPEQIVSLIDFTYLTDCITEEEAITLLEKYRESVEDREKDIVDNGIAAYTTAVGWLGYDDDKIRRLSKQFLSEGFTDFKMKAIDWMKKLTEFKPLWIEEPTSPDDVIAHKQISEALHPYGIGVATGEACQNRVMFKQFLASGGMQFCQIDSARMSGVNEVLAVLLMAAKYDIPVCPHAGGVGLCEMVQHLQAFYLIRLSSSQKNRWTEWVDHLHWPFTNPAVVKSARYIVPTAPGYSTEIKEECRRDYAYPNGKVWKELFNSGTHIINRL